MDMPRQSPYCTTTDDAGVVGGGGIGGRVADEYCSLARGGELSQDEVQTLGVRFESRRVVASNYCLKMRAPRQAFQADFYRPPAFAGAERHGDTLSPHRFEEFIYPRIDKNAVMLALIEIVVRVQARLDQIPGNKLRDYLLLCGAERAGDSRRCDRRRAMILHCPVQPVGKASHGVHKGPVHVEDNKIKSLAAHKFSVSQYYFMLFLQLSYSASVGMSEYGRFRFIDLFQGFFRRQVNFSVVVSKTPLQSFYCPTVTYIP